jgi:hypothetical protein
MLASPAGIYRALRHLAGSISVSAGSENGGSRAKAALSGGMA